MLYLALAGTLSYPCVSVSLLDQREPPKHSPDGPAIGGRPDADRRERVTEVGLADGVVRDRLVAQIALEGEELLLVAGGEDDGVSVVGEVARRAVAGSVRKLRELLPAREVGTDDEVVNGDGSGDVMAGRS